MKLPAGTNYSSPLRNFLQCVDTKWDSLAKGTPDMRWPLRNSEGEKTSTATARFQRNTGNRHKPIKIQGGRANFGKRSATVGELLLSSLASPAESKSCITPLRKSRRTATSPEVRSKMSKAVGRTKKAAPKRPWLKDDLRILKRMARKEPLVRIAAALKRTPGATRQRATQERISLRLGAKNNQLAQPAPHTKS
jgi:hypothetical protein